MATSEKKKAKETKKETALCSYYKVEKKPQDGSDCYTFEPENHDAYTCMPRLCGKCYYYKK